MFAPGAPNSSRHLSIYNGPQDDTLSLQQQLQGLTQEPVLPMHSHGDLAAGAVAHDSTRLDINMYNGLSSAAVDLNPTFDFDVNNVNDLFGTPDFTPSQNELGLMLGNPQSELGLMPGNQSEEWIFGHSDVPSMASAANPSAGFNAAGRWTLVDETSDPCYLNNVSMLAGVLSHRISNQPPQVNSVSYATTSNNAHGYQLDNALLGPRMHDPQYCFQNSPNPLTICDQYQFQNCSSFQTNVPLDMPWTPAPNTTHWDPSLDGDAIESAFRAPLNGFYPEVIPSIPHNSLMATRSRSPPENDTDSLELGGNASKFQRLSHVNKRPAVPASSANKRLGGRRKGPLTEETRKKANVMRNMHACMYCNMNHLSCSPNENEICKSCKGRTQSPFPTSFCSRGDLEQYFGVFVPDRMNGHLGQAAIKEITNSLAFSNNSFMVEMSTSPTHPPILIPVCEYISPDDKFLLVSDLTSKSNDHLQSFATTPTLPLAMHNYDLHQLKPLILEHIKAISHSSKIPGDPETFTVKLLKRICRFREANPSLEGNDLLLKAIMVDRIYYVKSHYILISDSSAPKVLESLLNPPRVNPDYLASKHVNLQLKGLFNIFLKDLKREILVKFTDALKDNGGDNFLPYLCVFLVFCMCAEGLQIAIDAFAFKAKGDLDEAAIDAFTLNTEKAALDKWAAESCIRLDKFADHAWCFLFKYMKRHVKEKPNFLNGFPRGDHSRYTEAEVMFIGDLYQIITEHEDKITKKAKIKYSGGSSKLTADHKLLRNENPGRIISQILKFIMNLK